MNVTYTRSNLKRTAGKLYFVQLKHDDEEQSVPTGASKIIANIPVQFLYSFM